MYRLGKDILFESLSEVVEVLINDHGGKSAVEIMVEICYQKHPTSLANFVHISKVKRIC